jgi:hypothetical protein
MKLQNDLMLGAADELRQALADDASGQVCGRQVAQALAEVERALRLHAGDAEAADQSLMDQDRALLPSPGVERRAEGLRHELDDLVRDVRQLRIEAKAGRANPRGTDPDALAERLRCFVRALERQEQGEIDLVQESITTDIGAGD